ncbi:MAG TPA: redox-sensing transcriptional repressor Rex [Candidatus Saccharimonadales bacterium]|nr:redox-sensing transcriptional repressor Rex [Candidatus Saccharimonadales bacterium]
MAPGVDEPSDASTSRLSLYLRALARCEGEGVHLVSSDELAASAGVKPALVRKDLTQFGQFGIRGVGYEVRNLRTEITRILGLDRDHGVIILGAGNLGMALADSRGFNTGGFRTLALFDQDLRKVGGRSRKGVPVRPMRELTRFAKRNKVEVAVIAVPLEAAQKALDQAVRAGVRAVLNFAPAVLRVPRDVTVRSVDLKIHLEALSYRLSRSTESPSKR